MGFFCCLNFNNRSRGDAQGNIPSHEGVHKTPVEALKAVTIPQIHPDHSFPEYGWTIVAPHAELSKRYQALLESSKAFFALPEAEKEVFKTRHGSEDGWNVVDGEKEFITIRSLDRTPAHIRDAAMAYWAEAGALLNQMLGKIAESLDLSSNSLTVFSEPCLELKRDATQSMLRLFRYNVDGERSKIVAEAHRDLGLLSLVMSDTPGLEVCDPHGQRWFPLEKTYRSPVLLAGCQLECLTNKRYISGGHLVRSYPVSTPNQITAAEAAYRYSIVFVLRAHTPVPVNTDELTTPLTGIFSRPLKDITAGELLRNIQAAHFNINAGIEERDEQKRKLAEKKKDEGIECAGKRSITA
ncbi:Clavaminate synthase-like protein [Stipitochalara longipes BDJ]|nr:Clavaminate synthase-like protein [Stipitochalara longipes BDJ]